MRQATTTADCNNKLKAEEDTKCAPKNFDQKTACFSVPTLIHFYCLLTQMKGIDEFMTSLKQFLKEEVKPALGCTEPVAVALAVVRAREALPVDVETAQVILSSNVFKNGSSVGIPGTNGLKGNDVAAALAMFFGKSDDALEVLKGVSAEDIEKAKHLLKSGAVAVQVDFEHNGVYVKAIVRGRDNVATTVIEKSHTNIVEVTLNGKPVFTASASSTPNTISAAEAIASMTWNEVMGYVDEMDQDDVEFMFRGADMNLAIAEEGFKPGMGLGVGRTILSPFSDSLEEADIGLRIKAWSAAASDARMSGVAMPVMSSAGSGNHGITAVVPVALYGKSKKLSNENIAKALLISHLATAFVKSRAGRLSSTCGCAFAAGAGAGAGIAWLMTGNLDRARTAVEIVVSNLIGMLCDGGKETCAFKVGTGALEGYHAAVIAASSVQMEPQGVLGASIEETLKNAGQISGNMESIERTMLDILDDRKKKHV